MAGGGFRGENIWVYDTDEDKLNALYEDCGITICPSGESVASGVDTWCWRSSRRCCPRCCPPVGDAAPQPAAGDFHRGGQNVASLEELLGEGLPLIRVMPNINAKVNESISAFCGNRLTEEGHKAVVRRIFEAVGEVIELEEKLFSAFSVIASCSPAYTLLYVDALAQAGVQFGIPKPLALKIASQAVLGTTRLLQETGEHPRALADQVCSPGGTTIAGVCSLQKDAFEAAVVAAAQASLDRDKQL